MSDGVGNISNAGKTAFNSAISVIQSLIAGGFEAVKAVLAAFIETPAAIGKGVLNAGRIYEDSDKEFDSELDDFIDDGDDNMAST
ncbi:hypothetical protein HCN44_007536 [Aphidius gifuensis]|uniref:Uncharacterized protein n=1 Tax=Aphidius gifuensis TaxID=684658 RepID=A0A834XM27_APHGI|nr:hypothetical protein HCN44_007536 [Aphidius gifuensis]